MTAVRPVPARSAAADGVLVPASCRLAILVGDADQIDMVLPAAVRVDALTDATRDAVNRQLRAAGEDELPAGSYAFVRAAGMTPLAGDMSLAAQGITDAELIALVPAERAVRYTPNIENVSTALAQWGRKNFPAVTIRDASVVAVALTLVALALIAGLLWRMRWAQDQGWLIAAVFAGGSAVLAAAAWVCARLGTEQFITGATAAAAAAGLVCAGACAPPGAHPGAPHAFLAALVAIVAMVGLSRVTGGFWVSSAAVVTAACAALGAAAVRMFFAVPGQRIAVVILVAVLVASVASSAVARWMARVPRQSFRSITGKDIFARRPGQPEDTLSPVPDAPDDVTLRGEQVAEVALRANRVLRGILLGIAVVQVAASWFALDPAAGRQWPFVVVVVVCALCSLLRARAFRDRRCAMTLVAGAALSLFALPVHYGLSGDAAALAPGLWAAAVLLAVTVAVLAGGIFVPAHIFSETVRELAEWLEYVLYVLVVPFAAWAIGYLHYVRNH